jgi:transcription termination factor Rho
VAVLKRTELERSPLADLHAIASEVGIEGFRRLRRDELVGAILEHAGDEQAADGGDGAAAGEDAGRRTRTGGDGRGRKPEAEPPKAEERPAPRGGRRAGEQRDEREREREEEPEGEPRTGILDVLPNGSGFLRGATLVADRDDPHVSPAQIRRCELRAGDEVSGPVRPPRRSERHPSLVRVETVNGEPAEPPAERSGFEEATPGYPTEPLAVPDDLGAPPIGRGSRVALVGPPAGEGSAFLRRLVLAIHESDPSLEVTVALAGARPEDVPEWRRGGLAVVGGAADAPVDDQAQAAELALARAKRVVERGGHAVLAVDWLTALAPDAAQRIFAAARRLEDLGSLTVIATVGHDEGLARLATTRLVLDPGAGARGEEPPRAAPASDTVRADLLGG